MKPIIAFLIIVLASISISRFYIDDVIALLALVKDRQKARNQTYHIAVKDSPTYLDVYKMICNELGIKHIEVQ